MKLARWLAEHALPPLVLLIVVISAWHLIVTVFQVPRYVLPSPAEVWRATVQGDRLARLAMATTRTAAAAAGGFAVSLLVGTGVALLFSQSRWLRLASYPYAIFLQTVPIVAIAPLIVAWFGYGFQSVVVVAFVISLFPIIANGTAGLMSVPPPLVDLFRLYRATRMQVLWKLRFPHAVPHLVTGARTSSGLAVVGAIVGEFFVGYGTKDFGLGYLIYETGVQLKTAELFAAIFASALLGVTIFATVTLVGTQLLARWHTGHS